MKYYLVIDFETSDLLQNNGQPVELGAVLLDKKSKETLAEFHSLVQFDASRFHWGEEAEATHGISRETLAAEGLPMAEVWAAFVEWLGSWINLEVAGEVMFCGQNILFDLRFLQVLAGVEPHEELLPPWACRTVRDTMQWAGLINQATIDGLGFRAAPFKDPETGHPSVALESLADSLGIPVVGAHSALEDARVTARVMVAILQALAEDLTDSRKWQRHLERISNKKAPH